MGLAKDCFHVFGKREINSFAGFIKEFCRYWDRRYEEEQQIEDLLDESISLNEDHAANLKSEEFEAASHKENPTAKVCHEDCNIDIQASATSSFNDKGLVSHFPFQISEFNDETLDDLKSIDTIKNPLEDEYFSSALVLAYEGEDGSQKDEDVGFEHSFLNWKV